MLSEDQCKEQLPHLTVRKLTGTDGGATKKLFLEDISETFYYWIMRGALSPKTEGSSRHRCRPLRGA